MSTKSYYNIYNGLCFVMETLPPVMNPILNPKLGGQRAFKITVIRHM